ncbi:MAG TPA: hypothetical protein VEF34_03455 [Syntrophobacteraceae bacterium]|nr:hypothetical protein [Syntrophobacteraceae bacterium]
MNIPGDRKMGVKLAFGFGVMVLIPAANRGLQTNRARKWERELENLHRNEKNHVLKQGGMDFTTMPPGR